MFQQTGWFGDLGVLVNWVIWSVSVDYGQWDVSIDLVVYCVSFY